MVTLLGRVDTILSGCEVLSIEYRDVVYQMDIAAKVMIKQQPQSTLDHPI